MRSHEVLQEWVSAHGAGDLEQLKRLYTEDSVFHRTGIRAASSDDLARKVAEFDYAVGTLRSVRPYSVMGEEVRAEVTERSALLEAAGIREARYVGQFILRGTQIESVQLEPTPQTVQTVDEALSRFVEWASRARPEGLTKVMPGGRVRYDAESGRILLGLMREWREIRAT
jgi:hypothetical protein